jgi:hypothetical protein
MKENCCVCEFQCFRDNSGGFVIKEFVVLDCNTRTYVHIYFKAPFDKGWLDETRLRLAKWLEKRFHGLEWERGDVPYSLDTVRACLLEFKSIYTRGEEKARLLRDVLSGRNDISVHDLSSSSPKYDKNVGGGVVCPLPLHTDASDFHCALKKAAHLANYLTSINGDFKREFDRLCSFAGGGGGDGGEMSRLGFYYDARFKKISCAYCLFSLKPSAGLALVESEHRRLSADCPTLTGYVRNVPAVLDRLIPR